MDFFQTAGNSQSTQSTPGGVDRRPPLDTQLRSFRGGIGHSSGAGLESPAKSELTLLILDGGDAQWVPQRISWVNWGALGFQSNGYLPNYMKLFHYFMN